MDSRGGENSQQGGGWRTWAGEVEAAGGHSKAVAGGADLPAFACS